MHVLGKDIVRFHAIYWPALLLAVGIPPPKRILSHAHWTLGRKKMSKSTGNVVNPFYAIDRFGVDAMRYYLIHDGGIEKDSDYGNEYIVERYKKGLQFGLGNLLGRVTRSKLWSVRDAVVRVGEHGLPQGDGGASLLNTQTAILSGLRQEVAQSMSALDPGAALRAIMEAVYQVGAILSPVMV